jgi:hypothetical protein
MFEEPQCFYLHGHAVLLGLLDTEDEGTVIV